MATQQSPSKRRAAVLAGVSGSGASRNGASGNGSAGEGAPAAAMKNGAAGNAAAAAMKNSATSAYELPLVHVRLSERVVNIAFWGSLAGTVALGVIDPPLAALIGAGVVVARHRRNGSQP